MEAYGLLVLGTGLLLIGALPWLWGLWRRLQARCPVCGRALQRCPAVAYQARRPGDGVLYPPADYLEAAAPLVERLGSPLPEGWKREFLPHAIPPQLRHLRNADGSVNREAFVVLRGPGNLAPTPREGDSTMPNDPNPAPQPGPDEPQPPPDA